MNDYPHIRKLLDLAVLALPVAALLILAPKFSGLAEDFLTKFSEELSDADQVAYKRGIILFGYMVLVGASLTIIPCHSFFSTPANATRRVLLAILCLIPISLGYLGTQIGPDIMQASFIKVGLVSSVGVWLFALPGVLANKSIFDVIHDLKGSRA